MKKFKFSLKKKAMIGIIIVLLPVVITFFLSYHRNKAQLQKQILNDLTAMAEAYEGQVYQFLDMLKRRAQDFATDGCVIRQLLKVSHGRACDVRFVNKHLVENKLPLSECIKTINLLSLDGRVVASTNNSEIGMDLSGATFFIKGKEVSTVTEIDVGHGGLPELAISTPVFNKKRDRLIGVLVNFVLISELDKITTGEYNWEMGALSWRKGRRKSMEVYLVNKDKLMITNSLFMKNAILKQRVATAPVEACLTSHEETSGFYRDYRGVDVAGVSMYLPTMKWVLLVEVDKDEALVIAKDMLVTALITAVIIIGLICAVFASFLKRVVRPIRTLSRTAEMVAHGNFEDVGLIQSGDEIGMLYDSFNYMIRYIKHRTSELEKSNTHLSRLTAIIEATSDFVAMGDINRNVFYFNKSARRMLDIGEDEDIRSIRAMDTHPEWAAKMVMEEGIPAAIRDGVWHGETAFLSRDGIEIPVSQVIIAHKDAEGAVKYLSTIARDITGLKRVDEELQLLQALTQAVSVSRSLRDAMIVTMQKICNATGWVYGESWTPNPEGTALKCDRTYYSGVEGLEKFGVLSEGISFPAGVGLPGRAWMDKQPVWVQDVTVDPNFPRASVAREVGLKAGIAFPIIADNEVVTIVIFYHQKREERDERWVGLVSTVLSQIGSIIKRKQAEEKLEKYGLLFSELRDIVYLCDTQGNILFVNKIFERFSGHTPEEFIGKPFALLFDEENLKKAMDVYERTLRGEHVQSELRFKDTGILCEHRTVPVRDEKGNIVSAAGTARDITERKQMENVERQLREQLYHVQKLESVGTLAGGVAHDFNNILMAITGYGNVLEMEMAEGSPQKDYIRKILKSAERAAALTQGLLAFSRKQPSNLRPVYVNEILREVESLLIRVVEEDIVLKTTLIGKRCVVMADVGQVEQVLMNLATNARDAMPGGGVLEISSDITEIDDGFIKTHGYGAIGRYALITVTDTGTGMDSRTIERIFEPFFTTKEVGKGTGLGLAIVYGIVKQHGGYVTVDSVVGKGTTFRIYLPMVEQEFQGRKAEEFYSAPQGGTETILVAEDDEYVRSLAKMMLERHGYRVIEASNGMDAICKFNENRDSVDMLLVDVIMPGKGGKEVCTEIQKTKPGIKVLFMSGYSDEAIQRKDIFGMGVPLVSKPISPSDMLKKVREALDKER